MSNLLQWIAPWEPSVAVPTVIALAAALYIRGASGQPWRRQLCFWAGLAAFYAVSFTGFDYYSEHAFFMHRLQHGVLHHLAPFLIALSRPGAALAAGAPVAGRRLFQGAVNGEPLRYIVDAMNRPFVAAALFCGLIVFWLVPSVHFIAMLDVRLYRLMNWGMAINGLMFWNLALNNYALRPAYLPASHRIAMMLAVIPPQVAIGLLIFVAPGELYPVYSLCGRVFPAISALADQQAGGLVLWIHAAMMSVAGMLVVIGREWLRRASL